MIEGEAQVITRAIQGETSAFGLLYDHYQPKIYRFILIKVGRREEAEDLTHQVFLNALTHLEGYKHRGFPFSSWLYQIARNQVIDHYRTRKTNFPLDAVDPEYITESSDAETKLDERFTLERVQRAIRKLKPEHQDVILMRFVEELSLKETAAALEKTEGAVRVLQHRALKHLRGFLTSQEKT